MAQDTIRRLAADILDIGENRVKFDPAQMPRIKEALTRDDVRSLISEGVIIAVPARGVSRFRGRERAAGKRAGRRRGHGSRKGTAAARNPPKKRWMAKVRSQRGVLFELREKKGIQPDSIRRIYNMIKGNAFRSKNALMAYLKENNLLTDKK